MREQSLSRFEFQRLYALSVLINKYVKAMKWSPSWDRPYAAYLFDLTLTWCELSNLKVKRKDIWDMAKYIANEVENLINSN